MSKLTIPFVETMASYACNLSCLGCSNYSDINLKGNVKWETCKQWLDQWLERININDFGIIGGEPLANPEIDKWIIGSRSLMPDAQIRFTTNGLLLHKKMEIVDLLQDVGNSVFKITVHLENNQNIENTINQIFSRYDFEEVEEYGIKRYKTSNNFRFQINRPTVFYKSYKNNYTNMLPHNSNPVEAFDMCIQKRCPLLYKGKIYKCSTSGMLNDILKKFKRDNIPEWEPYARYNGISIEDSDETINEFIENYGKPNNNICGMCPSPSDRDSILDHYSTTRRKNGRK